MVVFMVVLMDESMEAIVTLSCFTPFWVSRKPDCKVLKRFSRSWLRVWAMRMGKMKRGGRGQKFCQKMIWMNVIRVKRCIQWNRSQIMVKKFPDFFFFFIFFTPVELYSGLKNTAVMKSPNA
jgi:hypothetical protein